MGGSKSKQTSENRSTENENNGLIQETGDTEKNDQTRKPEWYTTEGIKTVDKLTLVDVNQIQEKKFIELNKQKDVKDREGISETPGYKYWCKKRKLDQRHITRESTAKGLVVTLIFEGFSVFGFKAPNLISVLPRILRP